MVNFFGIKKCQLLFGFYEGCLKLQEENAAYDEINVTPMLDLAYV